MGYKILLIDDDKETLDRFRTAFADAGHELFASDDAGEALDHVDRGTPDLILIAEGSRDIPAAAVSRRIKESERGRDTPVVVLTSELPHERTELERRMRVFGCDLLVARDVNGGLLLEMLRDVIGVADSPRTDETAGGDAPDTQPNLPVLGKETNRDSPSPASFAGTGAGDDDTGPLFQTGAGADGGADIQQHLDSLFGTDTPSAGSAPPPAPAAAPARRDPPAAPAPGPGTAAARSRDDGGSPTIRPAGRPRSPVPSKTRVAERRDGGPRPAGTQAAGRGPAPTAEKTVTTTAPRDAARAVDPQAIRRSTIRQPPKLVEQLRQPRVRARSIERERPKRRFVWPAIGGGLVLLGGLATIGGWLIGSRSASEPETPRVARTAAVVGAGGDTEPAPMPVPPPLDSRSPEGPPATVDDGAAESGTEPVDPTVPAAGSAGPPQAPSDEGSETPARPTEAVTTGPKVEVASTGPAPSDPPGQVLPPTGAPASAPPEDAPEPGSEPGSRAPRDTRTVEAAAVADTIEQEATARDTETTAVEAAAAESTTIGSDDVVPGSGSVAPTRSDPGAMRPVTVVQRFEPSYAPKALKGVEPTEIVLRVQVDETGKIARVLVDRGIPGSQLEAAAVSAVLRWEFSPALENGEPTRAWTTVRFPIEP